MGEVIVIAVVTLFIFFMLFAIAITDPQTGVREAAGFAFSIVVVVYAVVLAATGVAHLFGLKD